MNTFPVDQLKTWSRFPWLVEINLVQQVDFYILFGGEVKPSYK